MSSSVSLLAMGSCALRCYCLCTIALRQHIPSRRSIVLCVTPLQSLMMDLHERFSRVGLQVEFLGGCQDGEDALIRSAQPLLHLTDYFPLPNLK